MKVDCPHCIRLQSEKRGRIVRFRMGKTTHAAPEIWLVGRADTYEREGIKPADAYLNACVDWVAHCSIEDSRSRS